MVLSIVGLLVTMIFGLTASTRSSLGEFRGEVVPPLESMNARLGRVEAHGAEAEARRGGVETRLDGLGPRLDGVGARLDRIIALLDKRLPRAAA